MDATTLAAARKAARDAAQGAGVMKGDAGKSAYQSWIDSGNSGTEAQFVASLAGKSAYEIWREAGNTGSQQDFLNSLKGKPAAVDVSKTGTRTEIKVDNVLKATVLDGKNGDDGKSAYDTAVENGFTGTESDWLESLKGEDGNGITDVTKTSTSGLEDTYTGTLSDGSTFTFKVVNGANKTKLSEFDNDEEFIKKTVENLVNYYKKSESYSKDEIDDLMRNIGAGLALSIVETLPAADISPTTIYLIKTSEVTTHTDYIYLGDAWVLAENSGVDTSGFEVVEVSNLPASGMLSDKVYRVSVTNTTFAQYIRIGNAWANLGSTGTNLANYYDKAQMTLILSLYVKKDELETALSEYTKTDDLAAVALSNSFNDLDDKPEIPDPEVFETKAHAEQTYATKEDLEDISQIDDATTSATKTWSSQKTSGEIAKAKIVDVADRAAYEQIRNNPNQYDAEKFYAFPEGDSLCIMHDDKEITGKTNTLQLGEPQNVTFPFTAPSDGLLMVSGYANTAGTSTHGSTRIEIYDTGERTCVAEAPLDNWVSITACVNRGHNYTLSPTTNFGPSVGGNSKILFYPFIPTTGEPVDIVLNKDSNNPIANSAVANKFDSFLTTNASKGGFCFAGNGVPFVQNSTDANNAYRLVVFSNGKAALEQWGKSDNALKKQSDITMAEFRDIEINALQNLAWSGVAGYWWIQTIAIPNPPAGKTCVAVTSQAKNGGGVVIPMAFTNNSVSFYSPSQEKPVGSQRFRCLFI